MDHLRDALNTYLQKPVPVELGLSSQQQHFGFDDIQDPPMSHVQWDDVARSFDDALCHQSGLPQVDSFPNGTFDDVALSNTPGNITFQQKDVQAHAEQLASCVKQPRHCKSGMQTYDCSTSTSQEADCQLEQTHYNSALPTARQTTGMSGHVEQAPRSRNKNDGSDYTRKLIINMGFLHYPDLRAASNIFDERVSLQLLEPDDVSMVKQQAPMYIAQMLAAFDADEDIDPPRDYRPTATQVAYFRTWQTSQLKAMEKKLVDDLAHDDAYVEKRCWLLLQAVIDMHENGAIRIEDTNNTFKTDLWTNCSARLEKIISILRAYTIVRLDVVKYTHIDQLIADPSAYIKRKLANMAINHKKQDDKLRRAIGRQSSISTGGSATCVPMKNRGRKRGQWTAVADDRMDDDDAEFREQTRSAKRARRDG